MSKKWAYLLAFIYAMIAYINASVGNSGLASLNLITVIIYASFPIGLLIISLKEIRDRRKRYNEFKIDVKQGKIDEFEKEARKVLE